MKIQEKSHLNLPNPPGDFFTLVSSRPHRQRGQLSLFFVVTLVISLTLTAFVVNVGLFVKAKINLQNAVDAAAYAGASVQARHLTNIAYLNWEMRNTYKEWMFKYYVLGNLSAPGVRNPDASNINGVNQGGMSFNLPPMAGQAPQPHELDFYNVPSICVFLGRQGQGNMCSVYSIPGLPRLAGGSWGNMDQITTEVVDALSIQKAKDCSLMSQLNYNITNRWTYGTGETTTNDPLVQFANDPGLLAFDRPGSWPKATEQAIRIRNLEYIVNAPPRNSVCANQGAAENCALTIDSLEAMGDVRNERIVKAFYSAYRNLGNDFDREMKASFTLSELVPQPYNQVNPNDLSNLLIPQLYEKYYLDLKLSTINYALFFTMFSPITEQMNDINATSDAACSMSKIGFPVPGYPFGFQKNPNVLTYYAVKGEARFEGLFNPFGGFITLEAYSAAKPMGARIGPKIFHDNNDSVLSRNDPTNLRSTHFVFGIRNSAPPSMTSFPLLPLAEGQFWLENKEDAIGGAVQAEELRYTVPNMLFSSPETANRNSSDPVVIYPLPATADQQMSHGLYSKEEFSLFKSTGLGSSNQAQLSTEMILNAIQQIRAPQQYDFLNYTIPGPDDLNIRFASHYGQPSNLLRVFAPLYGENLLYVNPADIVNRVRSFLNQQRPSVEKYQRTLASIAMSLRSQTSSEAGSDVNIYAEAANLIYDEPLTCQSLAGLFDFLYFGEQSQVIPDERCPQSIAQSLETFYIAPSQDSPDAQDQTDYQLVYQSQLNMPSEENPGAIFNAYAPGENAGADQDGYAYNPFLDRSIPMGRNHYSTKLIPISTLYPATSAFDGRAGAIFDDGSADNNTKGIVQNHLQ